MSKKLDMVISSNIKFHELSIQNLLNNLTRFLISCFVRMGDDSEEFLRELLTYDCPITGRKRVAGGNEDANEPTPKFLSKLVVFWGFVMIFCLGFKGGLNIIYFQSKDKTVNVFDSAWKS